MIDAEDTKRQRTGLAPWVMTFADLMTLLMCFFVLLLSFSEMDVARFKMLSGSMRNAFGVQTTVDARSMPKGTSIIAQEFSPGVPEPTPVNVINQFTVDSNRNTLDALDRRSRLVKETEDHAQRLRNALREEIDKGSVSVEMEDMKIIIRILEKASFDSGHAVLREEFVPIIAKIGSLLEANSGTVTVSGHTDDVPIANDRFRSNWELSTSRAVSVAHELLKTAALAPQRFVIIGVSALLDIGFDRVPVQ